MTEKEFELGDILKYNDEGNLITLQVVKSRSCKNCFFHINNKICDKNKIGLCSSVLRSDNNDVIFREIKFL